MHQRKLLKQAKMSTVNRYVRHLNPFSISIAVLILMMVGCSRDTPSLEPSSISTDKVPGLIGSLPAYAHFSLSGMAFYGDRLYVSSNLGLLVLNNGVLETLYQWQSSDPVIEGPWLDAADDALWIQHASNGSLSRLDASGWHRVQLPIPPSGDYSRGDVLSGFTGISSKQFFWIVGGGFASRWQPANAQWIPEPPPPAPQSSAVRAVAPLGSSLFYVVREGLEVIPPSPYSVYNREEKWRAMPLKTMDFKQVIATTEAVYVRASDSTLFEVTANSATPARAPGPCEAIALTSTGRLIASFEGKGIFILTHDDWQQAAPYPYESTEGEHWSRLAEKDGQIAYATTSVPHLAGDSGKRNYSGTTALWMLQGTRLQRVPLQ
ncbi:MAG: hypothetical protein U0Q18_25785 [Bryobacteraceae bacterium]